MTMKIYVPRDASARSVGAHEVADRLAAAAARTGADVTLVRNGSRGMFWLEPLIEVSTDNGRIAYGPVSPDDVDGLLDAGLLDSALNQIDHPTYLGRTEDLEWLRDQHRLTFARVGIIDPVDPDDYLAHGGMSGLRRAIELGPAQVIDEVTRSGLRGRGGAGFPAGIKWKTVHDTAAPQKFVCCNADEGDSGTFADRMLMEGDPFSLIEGMVIAGFASDATEGYIYLRSEYPDAARVLAEAIDAAYVRGWLGGNVLDARVRFDLHVRMGAGAYICGEETSMLESLEGKRGQIRAKPPIPALQGLFGQPTIVNNVLTLGSVPAIVADGGAAYAALGTGRSRGTQVFQLAGNIARGGVFETPFGITLGDLVEKYGGGTASGRPIRAIQVGGPLGAYLPVDRLDLPMDYEAFAEVGAMVGHGGVVVFDDTVDMARQARFAMEFCAEESCGKCTPCRVGSVRGVEVIEKIIAGEHRAANLALLDDLCEVMADGSLCAMGGLTPMPVRSALQYFPEDFAGTTDEAGAVRDLTQSLSAVQENARTVRGNA
jgi:formate dehydrogenase iron-sulfur subunit